MLLSVTLARADARNPGNGPYGGDNVNQRILRWERDGNRIILRAPSYDFVTDSTQSVSRSVTAAMYAPVIAVFPIQTYGPDSAAVINVTRLYTKAVPEFVGMQGELDEDRSYIERVVAFPSNVEIEATQTVTHTTKGNSWTQSALVHWSLVRLPEERMSARRNDERVGYSAVTQYDFGTAEQRVAHVRYITRWRLAKQDPSASMSDPVSPIVFYVDPGIPDKWKPWVKKGIEDWQVAFEAAGFRHAIIARDVPVNDPQWSMEDVRHTLVRWLPSTTENAYGGPELTDPRTGEILNGTVHIYHNVLNLLRDWYVIQAGPLDVRAQQLPLPDSLMGRLLEYVIAHEVGHSLGLPHDQLGSSEYPADSVRSRTWVHRMGHTPSIMDYSRFNYVAQPTDSIAIEDLIPRIGPYDLYAIRWGYAPIPSVHTPDDEKMTLDTWAREQDSVPWYRFSQGNEGVYGTMTEAVGDADPMRSTGLGVQNLRRVLGFLSHLTLHPGEDNTNLKELYRRIIGQWQMEMSHVVTVVGGSSVQYKSGSQSGPVYTPLPARMQRAAVQFLDTAAFQTPAYLVDEGVTRRFEPGGTVKRIVGAQAAILTDLLSTTNMDHLVEYDGTAKDHRAVYPLSEMLEDVRRGVWTELSRPRVSIDVYRQGLQQAYLDQFNDKLNPSKGTGSADDGESDQSDQISAQERALLRGELLALRTGAQAAIPRAVNRTTRLHLQTVLHNIQEILEPKH
jgi:hypothetical protein